MTTTVNVHQVVRVEIERDYYTGTRTHSVGIKAHTDDGNHVEFVLFGAKLIPIPVEFSSDNESAELAKYRAIREQAREFIAMLDDSENTGVFPDVNAAVAMVRALAEITP